MVCKFVDAGTFAPNSHAMTMADRIRYLLELRETNPSELSLRAGLSRGAIKTMLSRLDADERASVSADSLAKIAKAASVSIAWLINGEGAIDDRSPSRPEPGYRMTSLDAALAYHPNRWHPDTIAAAREMRLYRDPKLTPQKLEKMLDALDRTVRDMASHNDRAMADTAEILASEPEQLKTN